MTFEDIVVDETSLSRKDKFCVTSLYEDIEEWHLEAQEVE